MIRRLLHWLSARLPAKIIGRDAPYVYWYHLATLPIFGGVRIQLHRFVRSDPDGLHDHPWRWARSFVLAGWYLEERRDRTRVRTAPCTYGMSGDTFHRVVLPEGARECWTLFLHGPYVKHWGFITPISWRVGVGPDPNIGRAANWSDRAGAKWEYIARPRNEHRFDPWPATAPKGRDLREAA